MKKIQKNIAKLILAMMLYIFLIPTTLAAPTFTCNDLNAQKEKPTTDGGGSGQQGPAPNEEIKKFIVTVLEESITTNKTPIAETNVQILSCVRKTTCDTVDKKTTCKSDYVELGGKCTPGTNEFCEKVQAIIAQSGIDLLMGYLGLIYRWAAGIIGIVSVAYIIYGGFLFMTAQDDTSQIDKAKEKIFQSLGGLVILFLSAVILYTINPNFFTLT